jgi:hypothetical protein
MSAASERALWTRRRGDDWRWSWTTTDDVSAYDDATVLVQVRAGVDEDATLVASSETVDDFTANITVTVNFDAGELAWHIDDAVTSTLDPGDYQLEVQCEIGGDVTTILAHTLSVVAQIAVGV